MREKNNVRSFQETVFSVTYSKKHVTRNKWNFTQLV